jgi:hypothetical protein
MTAIDTRIKHLVEEFDSYRNTTSRTHVCRILQEVYRGSEGLALAEKEKEALDLEVFTAVCKLLGIDRKCSKSIWDLASSCCCPCKQSCC